MQITLIRHGKTEGNALRRYIGITDEPLSDEGRAETALCAKIPSLEKVYVSPLSRARETARLLFPNAEQLVAYDLREMDFGDFEGRSADDMADDEAYRAWVDGNCESPCPNGESRSDFTKRAFAAFAVIVKETKEENLTIVTHGGVIMAILSKLSESDFYDFYAPNLGGYTFTLDRDSMRCKSVCFFSRFGL